MNAVAREVSGAVSFWILTALAESPKHGYAILRDVELMSTSHGGTVSLKVPTLYAALERLDRLALIEVAGEDVVDGRARRYFRLTDSGLSALDEEISRIESRARAARSMITSRSGAEAPRATAEESRGR
ncbi:MULTISPECIES: PadR family transcriptional regulator [Microbacterium]|uniref:PadR family transcriptional regulator n=1 Tax=Microbacterium wangchenii TaxID=2541726 RepID=A0ABX5STR6_9MICO|nr:MULTISPECIES: PadR family transcriptional regulator [Microbacterium]MCK6067519.1 PadR family transcriptional regulator [Microbacterium sp. EYE_512]QBR89551.1 PadR family transcriptional regulator [Microbacterium wangchenii]TXK16851.1 PadR family transcriptional regulator [Microbacterium wangchenii]